MSDARLEMNVNAWVNVCRLRLDVGESPAWRPRAILAFAAAASFGVLAPGSATLPANVLRRSVDVGGRQLVYRLFNPRPTAGQQDARPLVILLHGSGGDGLAVLRPWMSVASTNAIVLASPDANDPQEWTVPTDGPDALRELVADVKRTVGGIDERRVYLFGHSAGGIFALYMGLIQPKFFAAVVAHGAALGSEADLSRLPHPQRNIPMLLLVGSRDTVFSVDRVAATQAALNAAGCTVQLRILPDFGHSYASPGADTVNAVAWEFLHDKRLASPPQFTAY